MRMPETGGRVSAVAATHTVDCVFNSAFAEARADPQMDSVAALSARQSK